MAMSRSSAEDSTRSSGSTVGAIRQPEMEKICSVNTGSFSLFFAPVGTLFLNSSTMVFISQLYHETTKTHRSAPLTATFSHKERNVASDSFPSPLYFSMSPSYVLRPLWRINSDMHPFFSSISFDDSDCFTHQSLLSGSKALHETWTLSKKSTPIFFKVNMLTHWLNYTSNLHFSINLARISSPASP